MDPIYYIIFTSLAIGLSYSIFRKKIPARVSQAGWTGLMVISAHLLGILWCENETLVRLLGLMLMATVTAIFFLTLGLEIGKFFRQHHFRR